MKATKATLAGALILAGCMASSAVFAQHHHHRHGPRVGFGIQFGVPLYSPWYYRPAPAYYYPPVVVAPAPPVYVEQSQPAVVPPVSDWFYCAGSQAYYPYVRECQGGWQRVPAQPVYP